MPEEKDLYVSQASGSIILKGSVANVIAADKATGLADAYLQNLIRSMKSGGSSTGSSSLNDANRNPSGNVATTSAAGAGMAAPKVINFLKIRDPQQVMLEVRIAEISKSLLDQLGVNVSGSGGGSKFSIVSNFPTPNSATASGGALLSLLNSKIKVNGEKDDSLVKVLAEPTIVAISGQEGSFLAGGKVLIPQTNGLGQASTSEFLYGIGLKFMPTVLDQGRINLKVTPEVSDISKELVLQGSNNTSAILPNFTIRMVSTTVQIREGETLVIGGLMKNNVTETVKAFPVLGELPVLGPLFRSKGFASELTELVVVITPSLVAATDRMPELPTDRFTPPSRQEFFLGNALQKEGPSSSSVEGN
jgi:pilus assembly protein CpaC